MICITIGDERRNTFRCKIEIAMKLVSEGKAVYASRGMWKLNGRQYL